MNWRNKTSTMPNSQIRELRKKVADEFIIRYNIQPINNEQRIVPVTTTPVKKVMNLNRSFDGNPSSAFVPGNKKNVRYKWFLHFLNIKHLCYLSSFQFY